MHVIVPNKARREVHKATYYIPTHVVKDTKTTSVNKETIPIYQTELSYVNLYLRDMLGGKCRASQQRGTSLWKESLF